MCVKEEGKQNTKIVYYCYGNSSKGIQVAQFAHNQIKAKGVLELLFYRGRNTRLVQLQLNDGRDIT